MADVMRLCFRLAVSAISYAGFIDEDSAIEFVDEDGAILFVDEDGTQG